MPLQPYSSLPRLRSKIGAGLIFAIPFLGLFIVVGLSLLYLAWDERDPSHKLMGFAFIALPVFLYTLMIQGYYKIRIEDGWVSLDGFFQKSHFPLSDITAYAMLYRRNKSAMTEALHLALADESMVKIDSPYYRNYDEIRDVLIQGKTIDPVFQAKADKHRKRNELTWIGCALGMIMLTGVYIWYESEKPPLSAQDVQAVPVTLSEKPFVETETNRSGRSSSTRTFIRLHTVELPGLPLLLEGPAFDGAEVATLTDMLEAGDRIQVMVFKQDRKYLMRAMKAQEITGKSSVGVCAVSGKGYDFLSLESYDLHFRAKLRMILLILAVNMGFVLLIAAWKYRQYPKIRVE